MTGRRSSGGHGSVEDFLRKLLTLESGIDPGKLDWYVSNFNKHVLWYPKVERPGRPVRDPVTGRLVSACITVAQYFEALGVDDLFEPRDPTSMVRMQFAAINALGFVGYQFGEPFLERMGCYAPATVSVEIDGERRLLKSMYSSSQPDDSWARGTRHRIERRSQGYEQLDADANYWEGAFSGKYGATSLADLRTEPVQQAIVKDALLRNYHVLRSLAAERGLQVQDILSSPLDIRVHDELPRVSLRCSLAGALAAAHLIGAEAVADLLLNGGMRSDEFGTPAWRYIAEFASDPLSETDLEPEA